MAELILHLMALKGTTRVCKFLEFFLWQIQVCRCCVA